MRNSSVVSASLLAVALLCSSRLSAQILERAVVLRNADLLTSRGELLEDIDVVLKKGKIVDLGRDLSAPMLSKEIDLDGKVISAGLIDVYGAVGLTGGSPIASPTSHASDAFDRYASDEIREVLAQGVTAVYLPAGRATGIHGLGAVVRLVPDGSGFGEVVDDEAALCIDLGSSAMAVGRVRTFEGVIAAFEKAISYRRAQEEYAEALETYEKELAELAKKEEKPDAKKSDSKKGDEAKATPKSSGEGQRPDRGGGRRGRGGGRAADGELSGDVAADEDRSDDVSEDDTQPRPRRRRRSPPGPEAQPAPAAPEKKAGAEEKSDGPKKPREVPLQPDSEILLRAIDREVPVRVEAHRSADLLNAVELAKRYRLRLIIEGATEAHLVAGRLAEAKVPVVLTRIGGDLERRPNGWRVADDLEERLDRAGVEVLVGSGGHGESSRFPLFAAQAAAARGLDGDPFAR
ncbi:MAG: hypothetical protein KDC38_05100, partial [Planctomycetes bacterium]|nr:hypothetical protein [Planctomycetota bacterium]